MCIRDRDIDGSLFLYHEVPTNGIGYLDLMFDLKDLADEKIPYLGLLKSVLGYVDKMCIRDRIRIWNIKKCHGNRSK